MTCKECGHEMVEVSFDIYECPNCGYCFNDDEDSEWEDIYGVPPGCAACDNPDYPMCADSCPMFED